MISPLEGILGLIHPRVGHVEPNPLPEGAGYRVGGVDPAVSVEDVLGIHYAAVAMRLAPPPPARLFTFLRQFGTNGIKAISSLAYQDGGNLTIARLGLSDDSLYFKLESNTAN